MRQAYSEDNDYGQALSHLGIPGGHQVAIDTLHGPTPMVCSQTKLQKLSRDGCVCLDGESDCPKQTGNFSSMTLQPL